MLKQLAFGAPSPLVANTNSIEFVKISLESPHVLLGISVWDLA